MKFILMIQDLFNRASVIIKRAFSGKRSWFWIAVLAFVLIGIVFYVEWENNDEQDKWSYVYAALKLNSPGKLEGPNNHYWAYLWMGLCATLLIPFLTAAVQTFIRNLVNRRQTGRSTYFFMCNHYVLIGYNNFAPQILEQLLSGNKSYAVIMTTQNPFQVRDNIENELKRSIAKRVIIYAGDAIAKGKVKKLKLQHAKKLYLLDESETHNSQYARNLAILQEIVKAVAERQEPLEVYMQVNNAKAYNLLQRVDLPKAFFSCKNIEGVERVVVDFHPFNFYENWSRLLWSFHVLKDNGKPVYDPLDFEPLDDEKNSEKHVHLVISEFNSMGRALCLEALRMCHYPNFDKNTKKNRTIVTVFDEKWREIKSDFFAQYPYLDQICDIELDFQECDINSKEARDKIEQWSNDNNTLLTIAICNKKADDALTNALNMPEVVYRSKVRILVRQELKMSTSEAFAYDNKRAYPFLQFFGMLQYGLDSRQLDDRLAICINGIYDLYKETPINLSDSKKFATCLKNIQDTITKKNEAQWNRNWVQETIQSDKWSCRFLADMFGTYIAVWERHKILSNEGFIKWQEVLAEMEHRRWIAERTVYGFRGAKDGECKDKTLKIHPNITDYSNLDEGTKNYDRNIVNTAPILVDELHKLS